MSKKNFEIAFQLGAKMDPSVQKAFSNANKQIGNLKKNVVDTIKNGAKMALGFGVAGVAVAGSAVLMANKFAATGDRIDKLSQKIGLSRQGFQEWEFIMSQSGASVDGLQMGFKTLVNQIDGVMNGNKKSAETFKKLGISVKDANGNVKNQEAIFNEAVVALQKMEEGSEKAKIANDLFGRSGSEMMPLLNSAAGSVEDLRKQAHKFGMVISDDAVASAALWTDTMDVGKRALAGFFNTVAGNALPILQRFLEYGINKLPQLREKIQSGMAIAGKILGWLGEKGLKAFGIIKDSIEKLKPSFDKVKAIAFEVGGKIVEIFEIAKPYITSFAENAIPTAVKALGAILDAAAGVYNFIKDNWSWIAPIVGGIVGALIAYRAITQTIIGVKLALAAAQMAWNVAMNLNPIGLIVLAVGALIGIAIALWKNWDTVGAFLLGIWESFKTAVSSVGEFIAGVFTYAYEAVIGLFSGIGDWFSGIMDGVVGGLKGGINLLISMANSAINALNGINVKIPDWVPLIGGKSFGIKIPNIPMLATGGITTGPTLAMIGEGAEQEAVLPLSKLEALLNMPESGSNINSTTDTDDSITIHYKPEIVIHGPADESVIRKALAMSYAEFKQFIKRYLAEQKRIKL